jgi:AcrR family transcriptional regulator
MAMELDAPNTKTALVLAAGELFAAHGFESVSTRMIAEKAGANLSGIYYHFGTKESLYVEAFRYVCEKDEQPRLSQILERRPALAETPEGLAEAIVITCRSFLGRILDESKPHWGIHLILRELSNPSAAFPALVKDVFKNDLEEDIALYRRIKPGANQDEAMIWSGLMRSQALFYLMSKKPFEMLRDDKPLDQEFLDQLVWFTARTMIISAGLPVPAALEERSVEIASQ